MFNYVRYLPYKLAIFGRFYGLTKVQRKTVRFICVDKAEVV